MLGWVLALAGVVGLGVYEWFKTPAPLPALNPAGQRANLFPPAVPAPAPDPTRAVACGLLVTDWADTDKWSANRFGYALGVVDRLKLMLSTTPIETWPGYARRVYCTYVAPIPIVPTPAYFPTHWGK